MNLPLRIAFTVSHRFWVVVFSFSFISMHIWFLFKFLLSCVDYSAGCCSASICWNFLKFFSLNWYLICIVIRKDAWNDFNFFEFTKARFMAQDMIYPGEGSVCAWENGEIQFWGEMSYRYQLGLTGLLYHLKFAFLC